MKRIAEIQIANVKYALAKIVLAVQHVTAKTKIEVFLLKLKPLISGRLLLSKHNLK